MSINLQNHTDSDTVRVKNAVFNENDSNINVHQNNENMRPSSPQSNNYSTSKPNLTNDSSPSYQSSQPSLTRVPLQDLDLLVNPKKTRNTGYSSGSGGGSGYNSADDQVKDDDHDMNEYNNIFDTHHGSNAFEDDEQPEEHHFFNDPQPQQYASSTPVVSHHGSPEHSYNYAEERQPTYEEIQAEKERYLTELERLEKKMNMKLGRRFTMNSDINDIKYEYKKLKRQRDLDKSIRFQRKILMAVTSGVEFLNNKFDPIDAKLDGWSESVMENISDYDEVFEELHDKYAEQVQVAPELKLLMMVAGSAFMFHLTQTLFKNSAPSMNDVLKQNPELMNNIMEAAKNGMQKQAQRDGMEGNDPLMNMVMGGINMKQQKMNQQTQGMPPGYTPQSANSRYQQRQFGNFGGPPVNRPKGPADFQQHINDDLESGSEISEDRNIKNVPRQTNRGKQGISINI